MCYSFTIVATTQSIYRNGVLVLWSTLCIAQFEINGFNQALIQYKDAILPV